MITPMSRITLAFPASLARKGLTFLAELGKVQLIMNKGIDETEANANLEALHEEVQSLLEGLKALEGPYDADLVNRLAQRLQSDASRLGEGIETLTASLAHHKAEENRLKRERAELKKMEFFPGPLTGLREDRALSLWWLPLGGTDALAQWIEKHKVQEQLEVTRRESPRQDSEFLELSLSEGIAPQVERVMLSLGGRIWSAPEVFGDLGPEALLGQMDERKTEIEKALSTRQALLERMAENWGPRLRAFERVLGRELALRRALSNGRQVGEALVFEGWVPSNQAQEVTLALERQMGQRCYVNLQEPSVHDQPPVLLHHDKATESFGLFLKMVRLPAYGAFDPTGWITLFFPFFAGCIVGDAGYSLLMFALLWLLRKKLRSPVGKKVAVILGSVAFWGTVWGVLFGEYFGDLGLRLFNLHPLWVDRHHAPIPVLGVALVFGLIHVLLGLGLGAVQAFRHHHMRHGIEKSGNILVLLGAVLALAAIGLHWPRVMMWFGVGGSVLGVMMMAAGGLGGVMESLSSMGSVLSYVRIGAIGLSSAILALTAGKFLDTFGLGVAGIFSFLAIHTLNFCLAFAESALHSARLHYVEFMGKFYHDGGVPFKPFGFEEEETWKKD